MKQQYEMSKRYVRSKSCRPTTAWEGKIEEKIDQIGTNLTNHLAHHWAVTLACLSVGVTSSVALIIDIVKHISIAGK
jgi:hypothetical protein